MRCSPVYALGALDALVKAGEMSPAYAAGVADVLSKEAASNAQNFLEEWQEFAKKHPDQYDVETGIGTPTGEQAKQILRDSRHWYTDMGGRMGDAVGSFGSWLGNKFSFGAKSMSWEDMKRMHAVKQNLRDLVHLRRLRSEAAIIPDNFYAALQDQHTRDAETAWRTASRLMSPARRDRLYGDSPAEAKKRFRTPQGTSAMQSGLYDPLYDWEAAKIPTKSIHSDPTQHMFGSEDRERLFSQSFRNGLGMY